MAARPLNGDNPQRDERPLQYDSPLRAYVPPYYPERGQGLIALSLKLLLVALLLVPGMLIFVAGVVTLGTANGLTARRIVAATALYLLFSGVFLLPGFVLAHRAIRPLWTRWQTWRLRRAR